MFQYSDNSNNSEFLNNFNNTNNSELIKENRK